MTFSQPAWVPELGTPYPGAEKAAERLQRLQDASRIEELAKQEAIKTAARRRGQQKADESEGKLRELVARPASSVTPKRVRWLWAGRVPLGELTLIVGRGGIGKSTLLCTLAAWITIGDMRGEFDNEPRDVLYVANEDSLEYTVTPRLIAAGADLSRVHFMGINMLGTEERLLLPSDCDAIEAYAKRVGAVAVMLDPLSSNLRGDTNKQSEVRPVIEAIRRMCERSGMAAMGLGHVRKAQTTNLLDAIMGSSELGNVCRSAIGIMADPDDEGTVVLSQEKANLGRLDIPSYKYRINTHQFFSGTEIIETGKVEFLGKTDLRVSDMMADAVAGGVVTKSGVKDATEFVRDLLVSEGGEMLRADILNKAQREGFSRPTVDRAIKKLRLTSRPSGMGAQKFFCLPAN